MKKQHFFQSVRNYFMIACDWIIKKLPVNGPLLQLAEVADIKLRTSQKFSSVEYFMDKFSVLHISDDNNNGKDQIEIQFSHYQIEKLSADIIEEDRIDKSWSMISQIKGLDGKPKIFRTCKPNAWNISNSS